MVGDFERHLATLPAGGRRCVAFLGGTIGNLVPAERARFLAELRATLQPGDSLLLGTDLVKDPARLVAAYDDSAGVTAEFNRNVLLVINRELDADFRPERFEHVARWDAEAEWIEMRLRSSAGPDGTDRRPRPRRRLRRRRGGPHRGQRQVPAPRRGGRAGRGGLRPGAVVDRRRRRLRPVAVLRGLKRSRSLTIRGDRWSTTDSTLNQNLSSQGHGIVSRG